MKFISQKQREAEEKAAIRPEKGRKYKPSGMGRRIARLDKTAGHPLAGR